MEFTFYEPHAEKYFDCPLCYSRLYEGTSYCNCIVGEEYLYEGVYYRVYSLEPWNVTLTYPEKVKRFNDFVQLATEVCQMKAVGGPSLVYAQGTQFQEPRHRVPNRWKEAKGRDDLRQSRGKTFGGLKGSSLRARGTWRK